MEKEKRNMVATVIKVGEGVAEIDDEMEEVLEGKEH